MSGHSAQSEHFVLLPVLLGIWTLLASYDRPGETESGLRGPSLGRLLLAGVCFGAAVMTKQHGFPFGLFAAWYVAYRWWGEAPRCARALLVQLATLAVGALIPFAFVVVAMWLCGVFDQFWFWTITYGREYATLLTLWSGGKRLYAVGIKLLGSFSLIWIAALFGLGAVAWQAELRPRRASTVRTLVEFLLGRQPGIVLPRALFSVSDTGDGVASRLWVSGCCADLALREQLTPQKLAGIIDLGGRRTTVGHGRGISSVVPAAGFAGGNLTTNLRPQSIYRVGRDRPPD